MNKNEMNPRLPDEINAWQRSVFSRVLTVKYRFFFFLICVLFVHETSFLGSTAYVLIKYLTKDHTFSLKNITNA